MSPAAIALAQLIITHGMPAAIQFKQLLERKNGEVPTAAELAALDAFAAKTSADFTAESLARLTTPKA